VPVQRVEHDHITLANGERHPFGLLVWSTGIGPNDLVRALLLAKDRGKVR
jgi:NADH:ubiquinone reductase (non-electrogenic)